MISLSFTEVRLSGFSFGIQRRSVADGAPPTELVIDVLTGVPGTAVGAAVIAVLDPIHASCDAGSQGTKCGDDAGQMGNVCDVRFHNACGLVARISLDEVIY